MSQSRTIGPAATAGAAMANRVLLGILLALASVFMASCMNLVVKYLAPHHDALQILWLRYALGTVLVLVLLLPRRRRGLFRSSNWPIQIARSALLAASAWLFFASLQYLPLATAATISLTTPMVVLVLAAIFLKERVDWRRWLAVCLGCAGALIAINPGGAAFHWAIGLAFAGSTCFAVFQLLTRKIASYDDPETSTFLLGLIATVGLAAVVPFHWTMPQSPLAWGLLMLTGLIGTLGQYSLAQARRLSPASVVSPFNYTHILFASLFGFVVFGDVPSVSLGIGAALIVASGLYIACLSHREGQTGPATVAAKQRL